MDSYSAFWTNGDCTQTSLFVDLLKRGVTDLYVCGLAFDVCVKETSIDAVGQGFKTHVIVDACRGVAPEGIAKNKRRICKEWNRFTRIREGKGNSKLFLCVC